MTGTLILIPNEKTTELEPTPLLAEATVVEEEIDEDIKNLEKLLEEKKELKMKKNKNFEM